MDSANYLGRYEQLTAVIDGLLAQPLPVPAEKHILRERLLELELHRLETARQLTDEQMMQLAIDFTLAKVPQNVFSYPMRLREVTMPVSLESDPLYPKTPGAPATPAELLKAKLSTLLAEWRKTPE